MANFTLEDLLNLEASTLSRDLTGYLTYVYGSPKVGKTTLARDMGALILACENGTRAMTGAYSIPIRSWSDIRNIMRMCKDPKMKERYRAIAIDTVDIAGALCDKYVCSQLGISTLGEGGWSKNGWATFKKEFEEVFRTISMEGYAVLFISHAKDKEFTNPDGTKYNKIVPTASSSINEIVKGMCDIIAYGYQEMGTNNRLMVLRSDGSIEAGSRFTYIDSVIPFGYQSLVDAINRAIDEEEKHVGEDAVTNERREEPKFKMLSYEELQAEFMSVVSAKMEINAEFYQPKIVHLVETYLGRGKKFSEATYDQVEQMSLIIDELKEM
jgi:hypothetical protein